MEGIEPSVMHARPTLQHRLTSNYRADIAILLAVFIVRFDVCARYSRRPFLVIFMLYEVKPELFFVVVME